MHLWVCIRTFRACCNAGSSSSMSATLMFSVESRGSAILLVPTPPRAGLLFRFVLLEFAQLAILLALVPLEQADDPKGLALDLNEFAEGNNFAPDFLRRPEQLVAHIGANHADIPGVLVVEFIEH